MKDRELQAILEHAIDLRDAGKSDADIVAQYPAQAAEIQSCLSILSKLEVQRRMEPSQAVLKQIITSMPDLTMGDASTQTHKGRLSSLINLIPHQIRNLWD